MRVQNYIKWGLAILLFIGLAIFLLNIAGKIFIEEIVQEVVIKKEEKVFGLNLGEKAPAWQLSDLNDNYFSLSDFLGKPLILTFWASWNSLSTDQIKIFDEYLAIHSQSLFQIITINNQEDKSVVSNFIQRGGYQVKVLLDPTGQVGELYKVRALPLTYFLDKDGVIKAIFTGVLSQEMLVEKASFIVK